MRYEEYDLVPAVRSSRLKLMRTSPLHYHAAVDKDSPAMTLGRAVHVATLEPDRFPREYAVWDGARRGKDWTEFRDVMESRGIEVLTATEYTDCLAIRDAVRSHPEAAALLASGRAEQSITWTDKATGLDCKARIDFLTDSGCALDLKTARRIDDHAISRAVLDFGYHISAAFYLRGLFEVTGEHWDWAFIAVESSAPHDVRVCELSEDALAFGDEEVDELLGRIKECEESGEWPGAYPAVETIDLPAWAYPSMDEVADRVTITRVDE